MYQKPSHIEDMFTRSLCFTYGSIGAAFVMFLAPAHIAFLIIGFVLWLGLLGYGQVLFRRYMRVWDEDFDAYMMRTYGEHGSIR